MTQISELELIEQIPFMTDSDEAHLLCWKCYPEEEYPSDVMLTSVCGHTEPGSHIDDAPNKSVVTCERCRIVSFCPMCGTRLWV